MYNAHHRGFVLPDAFGNALGNSIVARLSKPADVQPMEGNQVLDGESVKYGSLQKVDNDTYSDQVAAIKKRYGLNADIKLLPKIMA